MQVSCTLLAPYRGFALYLSEPHCRSNRSQSPVARDSRLRGVLQYLLSTFETHPRFATLISALTVLSYVLVF